MIDKVYYGWILWRIMDEDYYSVMGIDYGGWWISIIMHDG